jgi:hypothetical protein
MADLQTQFNQIDNADVKDTLVTAVKDPDAASGQKGKWATLGQLLASTVRLVAGKVPSLEVTSLTATTANATTFSVGAGSSMTKILSSSQDVAVPTIASKGDADISITVSGAAVGDFVMVAGIDELAGPLVIRARVTATNTVTIHVHNSDTGSVTGATYEIRVVLIRFS